MKVIGKILALALFVLIITTGTLVAQVKGADGILGVFVNNKNQNKVQVYREKDKYFGKVIGSEGDIPLGTVVFKNFVFASGAYTGKVFSFHREHDFDAIITLEGASLFKLEMNAGDMSSEQEWTRVRQ